MKVWTFVGNNNRFETGYVDMKIGQEVTVYRCSRGGSVFGERAYLSKATAKHLVFTTESGSQIKTAVDNLFKVAGKFADKYSVSLRKFEDFDKIYKERVCVWNNKKCCFDYK